MAESKQRIGEYILDELLDKDAYAEEWRAHHHMWSEQEAMVTLPTDPAYVSNLRRENIRVHRLVHPSIIRPIGFDPMAEPPYLITEFVEGDSLRTWIKNKKLNVTQSLNILRQVLEALQYGHERGVVHGDIKPENIVLDNAGATGNFAAPGSAKVTDFGVGLAAMETVTHDATAKAQPNSGSLAYVAPEQRDGAPPDVRSDIYSVGVVLFEMLTGERPTGADLPSETNSQVPAWLDDLFKKSYARRERRFESVRSFLEAIAANLAPAAPPAAAPGAPIAFAPAAPPVAEPPIIQFASPSAPPTPAASVSPGIGFRADDDPPVVLPKQSAGGAIKFADAKEPEPAAADDSESIELAEDDEAVAEAEPQPEFEPEPELEEEEPEPEQESPEDDGAASVAPSGTAPTSAEPVIPQIPSSPSRADRQALFDELVKKQLRGADDLRGALKGFVEARDLDSGEAANIQIRLIKWANSLAGGKAELDEHITLNSASARPLYVIKLLTRTTRGDEEPRTQMLEHPLSEHAGMAINSNDYRLIAHFSADTIPDKLIESIPNNGLRVAIMNICRETHREFMGRIQREDLLVYRVNVITAGYTFDNRKYRAFFVGNALSVISAGEPFTQIRQEPTKRATALLNTEQIQQGIKELRRGLEEPHWEAKSLVILNALRAKLAATYVAEAKVVFSGLGWLESLDWSAKAGQLVPGHEEALAHASKVRKRMTQLQLGPGLAVSLIFIGLALMWALQPRPLILKDVLRALVQAPFFAAGLAALITTFWSWDVLRMRMKHTDQAFYQAALFPTAIAGILAFTHLTEISAHVKGDIICGLLVVILIVADILVFKKLRGHIFRRVDDTVFAGDGLTVLNKIEWTLREDWEIIKPHYMALGALYGYTSAQSAGGGAMPDLFDGGGEERSPRSSSDSKSGTKSGTKSPARSSSDSTIPGSAPASGAPASGGAEIDKLVSQVNSRISAALRTIAPMARTLVTLVNEYVGSVTKHQLGMMQTNATKIEQKGKDLAAKLADFDRLCRSPLSLNAGSSADVRRLSEQLAERSDDQDVVLLRQFADRAKSFKQDESGAIADLSALLPEIEQSVERLKRA